MMIEMGGPNYLRSHAPHLWTPKLNLYQTRKRFMVCVELAGMPREEIDVRAVEGTLHIRGARKKPDLPNGEGEAVSADLMEIDSGRFHRKVPIPPDVIVDAISAAYRHGCLWVLMPRALPHPPNESTERRASSESHAICEIDKISEHSQATDARSGDSGARRSGLPASPQDETLMAAKRHLLPTQLGENGLAPEQLDLGDEVLALIISEYTRDAGIRELERKIGAVCRAWATAVVRGDALAVDRDELRDILGPRQYEPEVAAALPAPGVVTGLAFTPIGGESDYSQPNRKMES